MKISGRIVGCERLLVAREIFYLNGNSRVTVLTEVSRELTKGTTSQTSCPCFLVDGVSAIIYTYRYTIYSSWLE